MINLIKRVINSLEDSKAPFIYFILTFVSAITLRYFLEFVLDHGWFPLFGFFHYYLFYVAMAISIIILFYIATRTPVIKLMRLILASFVIITLAPIVDGILNPGTGYNITYLMPGIHDNLLFRFFTMGGDFPGLGITPGLRVEVGIVLLGSFIYFCIKNLKIVKSLFYTFLIYSLIFCFSIFPFIVKRGLGFFGLTHQYSEELYTYIYLFIIFILGVLLSYLANKDVFRLIIKDIRPLRAAHYLLMFVLGAVLGMKFDAFTFDGENIFYFILIFISIVTAGIFSVITNNIADYNIDKVSNRRRPLIDSKIGIGDYKKLAYPFLIISLSYAAVIDFVTFFIMLLFICNYFLYSMPPLRLKRIIFFSKIFISLNSLILVVLGFKIVTGSIYSFPLVLVAFFLIGFTAVINFIDIKDYEGDKKAGIKTLPVYYGLKPAKFAIGLFFIFIYLAVFFLVKDYLTINKWIFLIPLCILALVQFILVNRENYNENHVFLVYLFSVVMSLFCIVYFVSSSLV